MSLTEIATFIIFQLFFIFILSWSFWVIYRTLVILKVLFNLNKIKDKGELIFTTIYYLIVSSIMIAFLTVIVKANHNSNLTQGGLYSIINYIILIIGIIFTLYVLIKSLRFPLDLALTYFNSYYKVHMWLFREREFTIAGNKNNYRKFESNLSLLNGIGLTCLILVILGVLALNVNNLTELLLFRLVLYFIVILILYLSMIRAIKYVSKRSYKIKNKRR